MTPVLVTVQSQLFHCRIRGEGFGLTAVVRHEFDGRRGELRIRVRTLTEYNWLRTRAAAGEPILVDAADVRWNKPVRTWQDFWTPITMVYLEDAGNVSAKVPGRSRPIGLAVSSAGFEPATVKITTPAILREDEDVSFGFRMRY